MREMRTPKTSESPPPPSIRVPPTQKTPSIRPPPPKDERKSPKGPRSRR